MYTCIKDSDKFSYDFKKFWKREPPKGIMRPFIKMDGPPKKIIAGS